MCVSPRFDHVTCHSIGDIASACNVLGSHSIYYLARVPGGDGNSYAGASFFAASVALVAVSLAVLAGAVKGVRRGARTTTDIESSLDVGTQVAERDITGDCSIVVQTVV